MPLIRRIPKRGFNNAQFATRYAIVNLADLDVFESGTSVGEQELRQRGLIRGKMDGIKILGTGEITKSLALTVDRVSASAREKIEKAGGSITLK